MTTAFKSPCDEASVHSGQESIACKNGAWILAATIIGSSITFIDGTVVNIALPILQEKLGASVAQVQWIVEAYSLMLSALILVGGALGDKFGRRLIFCIGIVIFTLGSAWCGLAGSASPLIAARAIQGLGAAMLVPGSLAIISASFPKKDRGKAIGTWSGFTAISAGFGPVLGGWLIENISWRWIFFLNLPLAIIVLLICWRYVPESHNGNSKKGLDFTGAILVTLGLGGIVYGLIESGTYGLSHPAVIGGIAAGVVFLIVFVFVERRSSHPMVPFELFLSRDFTGANLLTLLLYAALSTLMFFLPFNLLQIQHYSATAAGSALLPFVLMMFFLSRWSGGLVDKFGAKLPLVIGPIITGVGFALFSLPGADAVNYWTSFFPAIMVMSLGMTISVAPLTTTVMGAVDEHFAGTASGINNAVSRTAGLLAIAVFGVVMLAAFNQSLMSRINSPDTPAEIRPYLEEQKNKLGDINFSQIPDQQLRLKAETAAKESFVSGFRLIALISAGMAFGAALCSLILISGKAAKNSTNKNKD
jgi:EmrB/QacA subfamily drug resistance transporter